MKTGLYICYSILLTTLLLQAEPASKSKSTPKGKKAEKVKTIIAKIDAASSKLRTYSARFTQVDVEPAFDEMTTMSGSFKLMRKVIPNQPEPLYYMRFDYKKPEQSVTIINESKIILYKPGMIKPQESMMVDNIKLQALFAGFMSTKTLQENYEIFLTDESHSTVSLLLNPKTEIARSNFKDLRITFSKTTWLPVTIVQNKTVGQQITITFKSPQVNRTVSSKIFTVESLKELKFRKKSRKKPSAVKKPGDR